MLSTILSPLMHQRTIDKFSIYGYEPDVWMPAILADVDSDQLPKMVMWHLARRSYLMIKICNLMPF